MNIYAIVVIYNKSCNDSLTCRGLKNINEPKVIIVDNSTADYHNKELAEMAGWIYINMGGNMGLAKAYNRAVDVIADEDALICLFDDDSEVEEEYFDKIKKAVSQDLEAKVFLPLIYDPLGLLSPSIIKGCDVDRAGDIADVTPENITGINSGMVIRRKVFKDYRYDERFFLDYIDHGFLRDMKSKNYKIAIMDIKLYHQTFFESDNPDIDAVIKRHKIFKKDFRFFCGPSLKGFLGYCHGIINQKIYYFLKYGRRIKMFFI